MSKADKKNPVDRMRAEYDVRAGVRGKYALRHAEGRSVLITECYAVATHT